MAIVEVLEAVALFMLDDWRDRGLFLLVVGICEVVTLLLLLHCLWHFLIPKFAKKLDQEVSERHLVRALFNQPFKLAVLHANFDKVLRRDVR